MRVAIDLINSSQCSLDSCIVEVAEGSDLATEIAKVLHERLNDWTLEPGDVIRITELL